MTKTRFACLTVLVVVGGFAAALLLAPYAGVGADDGPVMRAAWAQHHGSLPELIQGVDIIVYGTVLGSRPGRTVSRIPFTLVDLLVQQAFGGRVGTVITVEQTGGDLYDQAVYIDGDGGPYVPGQKVLLFLNKQPDTEYFYLVNPQGRFSLNGGRLLAVANDDPVAQQLSTMELGQVLGMIEGELQREKSLVIGGAAPAAGSQRSVKLPVAGQGSSAPRF